MRTTIDLPEDLHQIAKAIARQTHQTLSETVATLVRRGLDTGEAGIVGTNPISGFPIIRLGRPVTNEDIDALEDEELEHYDQYFQPGDAPA